ncbi:MAG: hypothetical protein KUG82_19685 [Pseudomonadales bacterium]|nr:hypothetical protein [Pseudomonadales bacterium]
MLDFENQKFASWAPDIAKKAWAEELEHLKLLQEKCFEIDIPFSHDYKDLNILRRLFTYDEMRFVWEGLDRYNLKASNFLYFVMYATAYPPNKTHKMASADYDKWFSDVKKTARKLSELIIATPIDSILSDKYGLQIKREILNSMNKYWASLFRSGPEKSVEEPDIKEVCAVPDFDPGSLSKILTEIANLQAEPSKSFYSKDNIEVRLPRPNHPAANRIYFMRMLTEYCEEYAEHPLRKFVCITTNTVFDIDSISEGDVKRIAPAF